MLSLRRWGLWIAFAFFLAPALLPAGGWESLGPPGGNVSSIAIDPQNPNNVYAGTYQGVFKSTDRGETWRFSNRGLCDPYGFPPFGCAGREGLEIRSIQVDPSRPNVVYAGTWSRGFFRSEDSGENWTRLSGYPAASGLSLAVDPRSSSRLLGVSSVLYRSEDEGSTWALTATVGGIQLVTFDPLDPSVVWAAGGPVLIRSEDGGRTWVLRYSFPINGGFLTAIAVDKRQPGTLFLASIGGLFKSSDHGQTFSSLDVPGYRTFYSLALDPSRPGAVWAGADNGAVVRSNDGGLTWVTSARLAQGEVLALALDPTTSGLYAGVGHGYIPRRGGLFRSVDGLLWAQAPLSQVTVRDIFVDQQTRSIYVGTEEGVFRRDGQASSLIHLATRNPPDIDPANDVEVDPGDPSTIYVATAYSTVLKSQDRGASWVRLTLPVGRAYPEVRTLAVDPEMPATVLAGTDTFDTTGGILRSTDGGASWARTGPGGILTMRFGTGGSVYAAAGFSGLLISRDRGSTFDSSLPTGTLVMDVAVFRPSGTLYIAAQELYRSDDGGVSWTRVGEGVIDSPVAQVSVDPVREGHVYAATWRGDVYASTDAGETWKSLGPPLPGIFSLEIDPNGPTLYAGSYAAGLFAMRILHCGLDRLCPTPADGRGRRARPVTSRASR